MSGPIQAGEEGGPPLPSEALNVSMGDLTGWILRPEDLDNLPTLRATSPPEDAAQPARDPLAAYRPDSGGVWPDDRLTLSWAELRRLVALHLETCARSMPREKPWQFMAERTRAMRDGEVPLLVSEVLDQ
jgi:hypothetical protein